MLSCIIPNKLRGEVVPWPHRPPARHFHCRLARPGFPEFGRDAGGQGDRLDRQRRGSLGLAGAGAPRAGRGARSAAGAGDPGELDSVAAQARRLREWFRAFVQDAGAAAPRQRPGGLEPLNRLLERDEIFGRIVARPLGRCQRSRASDAAPVALAGIPAAADRRKHWRNSFAEEDFSNVKACEGPACTLMFADQTRGRAAQMVQHGDLRQSREAGGAPTSAQGEALSASMPAPAMEEAEGAACGATSYPFTQTTWRSRRPSRDIQGSTDRP